jgi:dTMP kinase
LKNAQKYDILQIMEIVHNFIVFEGGDGSGTSTQIAMLERYFSGNRTNLPKLFTTFEPTGGVIGQIIRSVLKKDIVVQADTLARLFAADRNEHLFAPDGIVARCQRGELVVCDRYTLSSLAYQGIECGEELPRSLNSSFPAPELLLFLDIDPQLALERLSGRPSLEIYEHLEFQTQVRERYHSLLGEYRNAGVRVEIIDASQTVEKAAKDVWAAVSKMPIFL